MAERTCKQCGADITRLHGSAKQCRVCAAQARRVTRLRIIAVCKQKAAKRRGAHG